MKEIKDLLAAHAFFKDLRKETVDLVAGCGSNVHFAPDQYLMHGGDDADRFFAVRKGTVSIEVFVPGRGPVTLQTVGEGEILGWAWLVPPYKWHFDARARDEVSAVSFDGACLRKKCDADPAMGYEMMKRLARLVSQRLETTRVQILDLYGPAEKS